MITWGNRWQFGPEWFAAIYFLAITRCVRKCSPVQPPSKHKLDLFGSYVEFLLGARREWFPGQFKGSVQIWLGTHIFSHLIVPWIRDVYTFLVNDRTVKHWDPEGEGSERGQWSLHMPHQLLRHAAIVTKRRKGAASRLGLLLNSRMFQSFILKITSFSIQTSISIHLTTLAYFAVTENKSIQYMAWTYFWKLGNWLEEPSTQPSHCWSLCQAPLLLHCLIAPFLVQNTGVRVTLPYTWKGAWPSKKKTKTLIWKHRNACLGLRTIWEQSSLECLGWDLYKNIWMQVCMGCALMPLVQINIWNLAFVA